MIFKDELRGRARQLRAGLPDIASQLALYADSLGIAPGCVVGGYHAHQSEADPKLLLARLRAMGCDIAYPRVANKDQPLAFHLVPAGEALRPGKFGIAEPAADWPAVTPDVLLLPLLAFDARGHRLGYGGGYYDRTLEKISVPAIGIAHSAQQVNEIPGEAHDRLLDAVLTERGLIRF